MAIASILHRISGILIFLLLPFMLYGLKMSLTSITDFAALQFLWHNLGIKFIVWCFISALVYHSLAGVRHLIMDLGCGETVTAGKRSAWLVFILALFIIMSLGVLMYVG